MKIKNQKSKVKNQERACGAHRIFGFLFLIFGFQERKAGFTLLEMLISVGIFAVVMIVSVGAVLAVQQAQLKAANIQDIQDNLRFSLESMAKEIRTGVNFRPSGGSPPAYAALTFIRSDGLDVGYCLQDGALKKISGSSANCSLGLAVTGPEVAVEQLVFYVIGQSSGPADGQPRITVSLRARSANPTLATAFRLQTTITQRIRDQ